MQTKHLNDIIETIEDSLILPYDGMSEVIARITAGLTADEQEQLLNRWVNKHKSEAEYVKSCFSLLKIQGEASKEHTIQVPDRRR